MRRVGGVLLGCLVAFAGNVGAAECTGENLFAALPDHVRQSLNDRAQGDPYGQGALYDAARGNERVLVVGTNSEADPRDAAIGDSVFARLDGARTVLSLWGPAQVEAYNRYSDSHPEMLFLPPGERLSDGLDPADWDRLVALAQDNGYPASLIDQFRPDIVAMLLGAPPCTQAPGPAAMQEVVVSEAIARGIAVLPLEPWDRDLRLLDRISPDGKMLMLLRMLNGRARTDAWQRTMTDFYFAKEVRLGVEFEAFQSGVTRPLSPQLEADGDVLNDAAAMRSALWLSAIEAAAPDGPVIALVNMRSLPGEAGLLARLAAAGFTLVRRD